MPLLDCLVNAGGRQRFVLLPLGIPSDTLTPPNTVKGDQPFFALSSCSTWNTSCTTLLLFSGDKAISSLAAATTIQKAG